MSRIAGNPVNLPKNVTLIQEDRKLTFKGPKGSLKVELHPLISIKEQEGVVSVVWDAGNRQANAQSGTMRTIINNIVIGISDGFEKKLLITGVGYRAQAKGDTLSLSLGYSHPIEFKAPPDISFETPSQTEIIVKGIEKQKVGQVSAEIRSLRPPEPYKGKGVRYADERIIMKEAKKK